MTTDELESKLEGGTETQTIEFKGACYWDVNTFAKDILAMANVQDGGYIIVGVKELDDNTFQREGITEDQMNSYKIDIMKDQISNYADPYVDFTVEFLKDREGRTYAVIRVFPFEEIPVICKKESHDTKKGVIYYRNRSGRAGSAPVSNSYDMREIIRRAAIKMMQREIEVGFSVEPSIKKKFDEELEGL
jgi:predicted HTH transcriptional regulator